MDRKKKNHFLLNFTLICIFHAGLRLFGNSYSGLEYDYLGLCHVYETLHNFEKYLKYAHKLENWQMLRGQNLTQNVRSVLHKFI